MKYLKLFENFDTEIDIDIEEIKSTLNDLFLELSDLEYYIDIESKDSKSIKVYCSSMKFNIMEVIPTFETAIKYMIDNEFEFKRMDCLYKRKERNVGHELRIVPLEGDESERFYNGDLTSTFEFWKDRIETYYKSEVVELYMTFSI